MDRFAALVLTDDAHLPALHVQLHDNSSPAPARHPPPPHRGQDVLRYPHHRDLGLLGATDVVVSLKTAFIGTSFCNIFTLQNLIINIVLEESSDLIGQVVECSKLEQVQGHSTMMGR